MSEHEEYDYARLVADNAELQGDLQSCHAVNADLMLKEARLRAALESVLRANVLSYEVLEIARKALANEQLV